MPPIDRLKNQKNSVGASLRCPPSQAGAGLYVDGDDDGGSTVSLVNVTIAGHACSGGNAILLERGSTATMTSSIVWRTTT